MSKIKTFNDVALENNTLVICDIDDTLLSFEGITRDWWIRKIKKYKELHNANDIEADNLALDEWRKTISNQTPIFVDENGFKNMLDRIEKSNSKLIYLTARMSFMSEITKKNFKDLGIEYCDVHYTDKKTKSDYVLSNINLHEYNKVIFIDDDVRNINDVESIKKLFAFMEIYHFVK